MTTSVERRRQSRWRAATPSAGDRPSYQGPGCSGDARRAGLEDQWLRQWSDRERRQGKGRCCPPAGGAITAAERGDFAAAIDYALRAAEMLDSIGIDDGDPAD